MSDRMITIPGAVPVENGATYAQIPGIGFFENVHVVIVNRLPREDRWMFSDSNVALKYNETVPNAEIVLEKTMTADVYKEYKKAPYNFTDYHAEVFLPVAFPGCSTLRPTNHYLQYEMRKEKNEGTRFQDGMPRKKKMLEGYAYTCAKLAYMVYFGLDAAMTYNNDIKEKNARYKQIVQDSNYGMWGKWYNSADGWHRGIDMCYAKDGKIGCDVHAILAGVVIEWTYYYVSIYNSALNITVTYMHLQKDESIRPVDNDNLQIIPIGSCIGVQSAIEAGENTHTHIEFNIGRFLIRELNERKFVRPWSSADKVKRPVGKIKSGEPVDNDCLMSLYPYPIIERIWALRR